MGGRSSAKEIESKQNTNRRLITGEIISKQQENEVNKRYVRLAVQRLNDLKVRKR